MTGAEVRADLVDMLTTHRHGEDKAACDYCAEFYGGIVDKVLHRLEERTLGGTDE